MAPTEHALMHSMQPLQSSVIVYMSNFWQWCDGHFLFVMCASYSYRKYLSVVSTGFGAVWPRPQSDEFFTRAASSSSSSMSPSLPLAVGDPLEDLQHPLGADPAEGALAAGLVLGEVEEEPGHVHHAGRRRP